MTSKVANMSTLSALSTKKKNRLLKEQKRRHPEISKEIILLWEELRQKSVAAERKYELCEKIMKASKLVLLELIQQKTTARVFDSVVEFGSEEHRWTIFEILKNDMLDLCKGKYSYSVVINMLKFGTKEHRLGVFSAMKGHIVDLLTHACASKVVEIAYDEVATSAQRREMVQEFYGKKFLLFKDNKDVKHLSDVTNATIYDFSILKSLHDVILPVLRKSLIDLSIVQRVILEYFEVLVAARNKQTIAGGINHYEPMVEEIVELVQDQLLKLCNTREGTKVAMQLYWESNAKSRKKILVAAKDAVTDLCVSENSYLFVLTLLDQTDDVKVMEKNIIKPILANLDTIMANVNGRKIIQFMIAHRDKNFFATVTLNLIEKGDNNSHSKKNSEIRAREILDMSKKSLLDWLSKNIDHCLSYSTYLNVAISILAKCIPYDDATTALYNSILTRVAQNIDEAMVPVNVGNKRKAKPVEKVSKKKAKHFVGKFDDEAKEVEAEVTEENDKIDTHLLESSGGQVLMRTIFGLEKEKKIEGFSTLVMEHVQVENLLTFISCNRTAFFLVNLFECGNTKAQSFLKKTLESCKSAMGKSGLKGVQILHKHLF